MAPAKTKRTPATQAQAKIDVGEKAPAFVLPDENEQPVSLGDLLGQWVVLYFYPRDNTPGCTTEACEFTDSLGQFQELCAVVLGCSPDNADRHRKFIAKHQLKIRLLSDTDHTVMEQYGAWGEKNMYGKKSQGVIRSTVLIDPAGNIAHHWPKVRAAGHADRVREKLAELR
uniref:thioredoxin-dependent peroxiredoxin n=1 Tax=Candidatus Kentrum sp. FM TaxID=2126340 RepID=A0A450S0P7_9GAMM|nr:MAG: peroxiredoxin Q/BCP [Candidatus Kentron sp. FM]VFJ46565.1 MAG: peroxiredoxin Q/BCP [Candidatus Kentron sp. FM]VFK06359.1 MAG: peroxiredoxin Q/BCP [Candidatus Kentron sp. FM]